MNFMISSCIIYLLRFRYEPKQDLPYGKYAFEGEYDDADDLEMA